MKYRLVEHTADNEPRFGCDDTRKHLIIGEVYIAEVEVHSWHTKLIIDNKKFNSVCFELVN